MESIDRMPLSTKPFRGSPNCDAMLPTPVSADKRTTHGSFRAQSSSLIACVAYGRAGFVQSRIRTSFPSTLVR